MVHVCSSISKDKGNAWAQIHGPSLRADPGNLWWELCVRSTHLYGHLGQVLLVLTVAVLKVLEPKEKTLMSTTLPNIYFFVIFLSIYVNFIITKMLRSWFNYYVHGEGHAMVGSSTYVTCLRMKSYNDRAHIWIEVVLYPDPVLLICSGFTAALLFSLLRRN